MNIVIFDMDGTLVDSAKDITISINEVRRVNHDLLPLSEAYVIEAINKENRNLAKLFYETDLYEERDRLLFEEHYEEQCVKNVYLYEGVLECIETLKTHGIAMNVATNAPTQFAHQILQACEVAHYFDTIIGADSVPNPKPSADMIHHILSQYESKKAIMIGDNSKDIKAGLNASIEAGHITWGFENSVQHHLVFHTPAQLVEYCLNAKLS